MDMWYEKMAKFTESQSPRQGEQFATLLQNVKWWLIGRVWVVIQNVIGLNSAFYYIVLRLCLTRQLSLTLNFIHWRPVYQAKDNIQAD